MKMESKRSARLATQPTMLQNLLFLGMKETTNQAKPIVAQLPPVNLVAKDIFARAGIGGQLTLKNKRTKRNMTTAPTVAIRPWTECLAGTQYGRSSFCGKSSPKGSVFSRSTRVSGAGGCRTGGGSRGSESDGVRQSSKEWSMDSSLGRGGDSGPASGRSRPTRGLFLISTGTGTMISWEQRRQWTFRPAAFSGALWAF